MAVLQQSNTKSSSGDEIANVNFLYDDIVYVLYTKYNRLPYKFRHRSTLFVAKLRLITVFTLEKKQERVPKCKVAAMYP